MCCSSEQLQIDTEVFILCNSISLPRLKEDLLLLYLSVAMNRVYLSQGIICIWMFRGDSVQHNTIIRHRCGVVGTDHYDYHEYLEIRSVLS